MSNHNSNGILVSYALIMVFHTLMLSIVGFIIRPHLVGLIDFIVSMQ